jgi:hypothetical protein
LGRDDEVSFISEMLWPREEEAKKAAPESDRGREKIADYIIKFKLS